MTIAIIGAGVAGLSAAKQLVGAGYQVEIFDKGRGAGGRLSTRRLSTSLGDFSADHGAQFFTVRDEAFAAEVAALEATGQVAIWQGPFRERARDKVYVGAPKMNQFVKGLSEDCIVHWGERVTRIEGTAGHLQLQFEGGQARGAYEHVIVAVPAEQAVDLLEEPAPDLAKTVATVRTAPCWAAILVLGDTLDVPFNGAQFQGGPLRWIARNSSKPGREGAEVWVLHANPSWSADHIEDAPETVLSDLTHAFAEAVGGRPNIVATSTHRWRYAMTVNPLGKAFLTDPDAGISTCGDWHLGARIEHAWLSGHHLGRELAKTLRA